MPQGRRKTPFSGKAKKEQLKLKKHRQGSSKPFLLENADNKNIKKLNYQTNKNSGSKTNRYALVFHKESEEDITRRKEIAKQCLNPVSPEDLEIHVDQYFPKDLEFPKRPTWSYDVSKDQLVAKENRYFTEYIKNIEENFLNQDIGLFELNLETWRQMWRVLEMSDIILYIIDIRFGALMFPPSLYHYVVNDLQKDFILVINKIDLAPASLVVAWKLYFQEKCPKLHIVMFTSLPGYNLIGNSTDKMGLQVRRRRGKIRMAAEGAQTLFAVCKSIVGSHIDISSWETKIQEEINLELEENEKAIVGETLEQDCDTSYFHHEKYKNGILTIGCIGQPNVGKSSLMNAIKGKKVVSVSKTPGHTKHFQTIFLTQNVKLCDCPGLVFPSKVPKTLQVLMGSFPIAQLREPYTTVKYLAERLDLPKLLRIEHPENDDSWSAMDICDGWAKKRGYLTAKAARLDSYRAANSLLRMALDGKICLCLQPPNYNSKIEFWSTHSEVQKVLWIQANSSLESNSCEVNSEESEAELSEHEVQNSEDPDQDEESEEESTDSSDEMNVVANKFALLQE